MCLILEKLMDKYPVALISGGKIETYNDTYLKFLDVNETNLHLFPTSGSGYYRYEDGKQVKVYSKEIPSEERERILDSFKKMLQIVDYKFPEESYGEVLEDRGTQITFSALGQKAPYYLKKVWDPKHEKRMPMQRILQNMLPKYDVKIGGSTSVDVTMKGINKGYGINKITEYLGYEIDEMFFVGDDLSPVGNDYPVHLEGVDCLHVSDHLQTYDFLHWLLYPTEYKSL